MDTNQPDEPNDLPTTPLPWLEGQHPQHPGEQGPASAAPPTVPSGATLTVTIGSSTAYGTAKRPATASSFGVGDRIGVLGARSGDTVTATRIVHLAAAKHAAPTGTPTPAATT
ncbi:hypothetical protein ACPPVW_12460 [Leifsonia sp. McL0607]|uniref:hypothetical protein n=1 Tax=Leifsonia sp. McL0607 TaxID=3415672 RepID=UPI003CE7D991